MNSENTKKVLIVYPQINSIGGAELVAIQVLDYFLSTNNFIVTLITLSKPNYENIEKFTGIVLNKNKLEIDIPNIPRWLLRSKNKFTLFKIALLNRHAKKISGNYDLCIGAYNEIDFGKKGLQYIHHPLYVQKRLLIKYNLISGNMCLPNSRILDTLLITFYNFISNSSFKGIRRNITLVNSEFMKNIVDVIYTLPSQILYPGFLVNDCKDNFDNWDSRKFQFITIGRISPDKDYDKGLHLFRTITEIFPNSEFIIIGNINDNKYFNELKSKINQLSLPLSFALDVTNQELNNLLKSSKFYVHLKEYEHFGISIVEAIQSGCIPFVHDSGGQKEIVTPDILRYKDANDLCKKIKLINSNSVLRANLFIELNNSIKRFNVHHFKKNLSMYIESLVI